MRRKHDKQNMANKIPRVPVREQDPKVRATNFEEVCYGYNVEEATLEASRCLNCKNPRCVGGAGLDYIQLGIQTGLMAAKVLTGEAACEDLPYETIENYGLYINSDAAAELGITIPDDIAQEAQECAE